MKNILVLIHDDAGQEARLQAALDIARALGGHLRCVDVARLPIFVEDYATTAGAMIHLVDEQDREAGNRIAIEARLAREAVPWDWIDVMGMVGESVIDAAGLADLIILNSRLSDPEAPDMEVIATRVVRALRKPVVAVPEQRRGFAADGRVLIAWDGSAQVARTMRNCIPLLGLASDILVSRIADHEPAIAIDNAVAYLARHDIRASVEVAEPGPDGIAAQLRSACHGWRADWCLMGAYASVRLADRLFGGVTRAMLEETAIPLVLGH